MEPLTSVSDSIRENQEKPVIGCFPPYPPVELFASMGLHPVVLWNLKNSVENLEKSDKHIQQYACGIARALAQFVMAEGRELLDAVFSYNACDTLRNLPEILNASNAQAGRNLAGFRMHLPQVDRAQSNPEPYLKNEITGLIKEIESYTGGTFSPEAFFQTSKKYAEMRGMCLEAEGLVAQGTVSFENFCRVVLSGYTLPVETQINDLRNLIGAAEKPKQSASANVVVSGIMPPPLQLIRAMEAADMRVVSNDIASLRRSYAYSPPETVNPEDFYVDYYTRRFPCTTLLYTADERIDALLELVEDSVADAVIFCGEKFCEHEYFEFPYLKKRLADKGIATLFLEFSVDDAHHVEGHIARVEAFSETLISGQRGE